MVYQLCGVYERPQRNCLWTAIHIWEFFKCHTNVCVQNYFFSGEVYHKIYSNVFIYVIFQLFLNLFSQKSLPTQIAFGFYAINSLWIIKPIKELGINHYIHNFIKSFFLVLFTIGTKTILIKYYQLYVLLNNKK